MYDIQNIDNVDTPSLVFYPEHMRNNLAILKSMAGDMKRVRPHIKTNKCPQVARLMMEAGIEKFKCATIAEAEMLAIEGAKEVLLAYQPVGPKASRFCQLQSRYPATRFSCLLDNQTTLHEISGVAGDNDQTIDVFIDLNVGMNRTGIAPGSEAFDLHNRIIETKNIRFVGLHLYDGHLRDPDLAVRTTRCNEAFAPAQALRERIAEATGRDPVMIAGGTPTFPIHAKRPDVDVSPGTFILWDKGYQQLLREQPFEFAAIVVTRVISIPDDRTICLDLGHKSIASENAITQRVFFLNAPEMEPIGHSEEHMVFRLQKPHNLKAGHVFYGVPYHICPTVALYEEASVCIKGVVNESWPILSRKRKITV